MHEHIVEGFRTTATSHKIALTAEKAELLLEDARVIVQDSVSKEYESAVKMQKI